MQLFATTVHHPSFTWLELSGTVMCHLVIAVLVGMAFRNHVNELRCAWEFLACVCAWWIWYLGLSAIELLSMAVLVQVPALSPWLDFTGMFVWAGRQGGVVLGTTLYVWAFQRRHGSIGLARLLWTQFATGTIYAIWFALEAVVPRTPAITITEQGTWLYHFAKAMSYSELPQWQSAIGWIIWYIGLFGGKPTFQEPRS